MTAAERVQARIDNLLEVADRFDHPGGSRVLARRARDKATGMEAALRILVGAGWTPTTGTVEDDLRSRIGCVVEATYWDRPYDERIAAIRGMCDLATNGMTTAAGAICPECAAGKHINCDGQAWDDDADQAVTCVCREVGHR